MSKTLIEQLEELPRWTPRYDGDMASSKNAEWLHIDDIRSIVKHYSEDTSLESHNRELLAVNQVLREALEGILRLTSLGLSDCVYQVAQSAIDKYAADLVEVGKTVDYETPIANIVQGRINQGIKSGLTLYTIQTKSNTE